MPDKEAEVGRTADRCCADDPNGKVARRVGKPDSYALNLVFQVVGRQEDLSLVVAGAGRWAERPTGFREGINIELVYCLSVEVAFVRHAVSDVDKVLDIVLSTTAARSYDRI